ncbi:MAG: IS30 family transposase [Candidatus Rickettsiella isopodorum]|nr:IS30 family transposase [Candidatus Rickettsiella isopodorum]
MIKFSLEDIIEKKKADLVSSSIISSLKPIANNVLTITADNGSEFAYHEKISQELETEFYFAHPYSSWERGLNENTNGLIRQYLKKGCDFSPVTADDLELIMNRLNNRPRKSLGFATPTRVKLE